MCIRDRYDITKHPNFKYTADADDKNAFDIEAFLSARLKLLSLIHISLRELEAAGYIVRHKLRDRQGRISDTEYVIYEQPQPKNPDTPQPDMASPDTENPDMVKPDTEKPAELNIEKSNTEKTITYG